MPLAETPSDHDDAALGDFRDDTPPDECDVQLLPKAVACLTSNIHGIKYRGALFVHKLAAAYEPPLESIAESGATQILAGMLGDPTHPDTQSLAAVVLTRVALKSDKLLAHVVKLGALPAFIAMLSSLSTDDSVHEQVAWTLGHVGLQPPYRDMIFAARPFSAFVAMLRGNSASGAKRCNLAWLVSCLFQGQPPPAFEDAQPAIEFVDFLCSDPCSDDEALSHSLAALSLMAKASDAVRRDLVLRHTSTVRRCVEVLTAPGGALRVAKPAMQALRSLATQQSGVLPEDERAVLLDLKMVACLGIWLAPSQAIVVRLDACAALRSVIADSPRAAMEVLQAGLTPLLVALTDDASFEELEIEALECIYTLAKVGGSAAAEHVMSSNGHVPLITALQSNDAALVQSALEALDAILASSPPQLLDTHMAALRKSGISKVLEEALHQSDAPASVSDAAARLMARLA